MSRGNAAFAIILLHWGRKLMEAYFVFIYKKLVFVCVCVYPCVYVCACRVCDYMVYGFRRWSSLSSCSAGFVTRHRGLRRNNLNRSASKKGKAQVRSRRQIKGRVHKNQGIFSTNLPLFGSSSFQDAPEPVSLSKGTKSRSAMSPADPS